MAVYHLRSNTQAILFRVPVPIASSVGWPSGDGLATNGSDL
jgi:hypothetical protein